MSWKHIFPATPML